VSFTETAPNFPKGDSFVKFLQPNQKPTNEILHIAFSCKFSYHVPNQKKGYYTISLWTEHE
jgi:hypothetical protein